MQNREIYSAMSKEDKYKKVKGIRILYPRFNRGLDLIEKCRQSTTNSKDPQCLLITGSSGSGKSSIFDTYKDMNDKTVYEETRTKKVILSAEIPSPTTIMSFLEALLEELGDPFPTRGTKGNKHLRLIKLIKDCGVELIMLDEFQHFVHPEKKKVNYDVSDCFKSLVNQTKVPVVLFGLSESKHVINCNPQLKRRFSIVYDLSPFGIEEDSRVNEFAKLLYNIDQQLPFEELSGFANEEMLERFYYATDGLMDSIMKLVREASIYAINGEKTKIDLSDLARAYNLHSHLHEGKSKHPFEGESFSLGKGILNVG